MNVAAIEVFHKRNKLVARSISSSILIEASFFIEIFFGLISKLDPQ
jgi:hypothetical protein